MLGHDLTRVLEKDNDLILTTSKSLDITNKKLTMDFIKKTNPDIVINSAAYTDVDGCESNQEIAYDVNGKAVENLAIACKDIDCPLVHISTDYVFNGKNNRSWEEEDETGPISIYGKSKLQGEEAIKKNLKKYFIIRTAWLYGLNGSNFPKTMLELAKNHDEINVVYDEVGSPTFSHDLAVAISKLIKTEYYGVYHITNSGSCSWCEFAKYIFEIAGVDVKVIPVTAKKFARAASRPNYSVLNNKNWIKKGFNPLRTYKEAVAEYINLL